LIRSLVIVLMGVLGMAVGVWFYVDQRAGRFFKGRGAIAGEALGLFYLPAGLGFTLIGIAFAVGRNSLTIWVFAVGVAALTVGMILWLVHPIWAQPHWMRSRNH
jgi:hypothetical protein